MNETPERWAPVPGFSRYEASDQGRVRAVPYTDKRGNRRGMRMLRPVTTSRGYCTVGLVGDDGLTYHVFVHRLVLLAFVGPPATDQQCRHLDGKPPNNWLKNLRWGTAKENAEDRVRHGTAWLGASVRRLTDDDIRTVRRRRRAGETYRSISEDFDVSLQAVWYACRGRTYRTVKAPTAPRVYRRIKSGPPPTRTEIFAG